MRDTKNYHRDVSRSTGPSRVNQLASTMHRRGSLTASSAVSTLVVNGQPGPAFARIGIIHVASVLTHALPVSD
jgi:hypothetical protein